MFPRHPEEAVVVDADSQSELLLVGIAVGAVLVTSTITLYRVVREEIERFATRKNPHRGPARRRQ